MNNNVFCPISYRKINEHVARLNAAFTTILLILYVLTGSMIPIVILIIDFLFRAIEKSQYSLLAFISGTILKMLKVAPSLINAGPKVFAARIGLLFASLILLTDLVGFHMTALVITGIFGVCALLEAAINYCVACKLYPFFYNLIYQNRT